MSDTKYLPSHETLPISNRKTMTNYMKNDPCMQLWENYMICYYTKQNYCFDLLNKFTNCRIQSIKELKELKKGEK